MQGTEAIAFEAAAALEDYEAHLLAMHRPGARPRSVATFQKELSRVRSCCLRLPQLSGASVALLLAHHKLLAELARGDGDKALALRAVELQRVEQCVVALQRACRELFLARHLH